MSKTPISGDGFESAAFADEGVDGKRGDGVEEEEDEGEAAETFFLRVDRHLDHESPFEVRPSCGVLAPASETEFLLTFCPSIVGDFHNVVELVLQCIPDDNEGDGIVLASVCLSPSVSR